MLDVIGALLLGVNWAVDVALLVSLAAIRPVAKFAAFVGAAAWMSLIIAIAALGGFAATGRIPGPGIAFLVLMTAALVAWFSWAAFRKAVLSIPLAGLVGVNAFRILGVCFLILHFRGRLAAPFATSAGWGDIITGIGAILLAGLAVWKGSVPRALLTVWNAFGALDLIVAVILGVLSAPGTPFQVFTAAPGTVAMGTLPWVGVPTALVPLYLMTHLAIATQLRAESRRYAETPGQDGRQGSTLTRTAA